VDVTWRKGGIEYFGIEFPRDEVLERKGAAFIDDWNAGSALA
jgi:hypothetical protein